MRDVIVNLLTFNPLNLSTLVYGALAGLWVFLLIISMFSIASQSMHLVAKLVWALMVVAVPVIGLFCYALFCLFSADHSWAKRFQR